MLAAPWCARHHVVAVAVTAAPDTRQVTRRAIVYYKIHEPVYSPAYTTAGDRGGQAPANV